MCVRSRTPNDGRKDSPKHVEWYSVNSKVVHLVGFTTESQKNSLAVDRSITTEMSTCLLLFFPTKFLLNNLKNIANPHRTNYEIWWLKEVRVKYRKEILTDSEWAITTEFWRKLHRICFHIWIFSANAALPYIIQGMLSGLSSHFPNTTLQCTILPLVGFTKEIYRDARSHERQINFFDIYLPR